MMAGGPGLSRRNLIYIIYLYFYSNRVYYTDVLNLTLERYKDTYLFVQELELAFNVNVGREKLMLY